MTELTEPTPDSSIDPSFKTFHTILTGYRLGRVMMVLGNSGLCQFLETAPHKSEAIAAHFSWDGEYTQRFLEVCRSVGFLYGEKGCYGLSPFAQKFLLPSSNQYQGSSLLFEENLMNSWGDLQGLLGRGEREVKEKSPEKYQEDLTLFLQSMDEAATMRSRELWQAIDLPSSGTILEIGAGSGGYLTTFLDTNPGWEATFCDLPDVVDRAKEKYGQKFKYSSINYLEGLGTLRETQYDALLLSNVIHCQSEVESKKMIEGARSLLKPRGKLIIHDFFTDRNSRSALYDIHMMVNTYNGRCYAADQVAAWIGEPQIIDLPSESTALIF